MSVKITNPDTYQVAGNAALNNGSFEFYKLGTNERRYASRNENLSENSTFQNALDSNACPIEDLWVEDPSKLTVVFRNSAGAELSRGALSSSLALLNPLEDLEQRIEVLEG